MSRTHCPRCKQRGKKTPIEFANRYGSYKRVTVDFCLSCGWSNGWVRYLDMDECVACGQSFKGKAAYDHDNTLEYHSISNPPIHGRREVWECSNGTGDFHTGRQKPFIAHPQEGD